MTATVASRPPARLANRLRMTRSRTLSSAPPMMMTCPSLTGVGWAPLVLVRDRIPARNGFGRMSSGNAVRECRRHGRRPATAGTATGPGHGSGAGTGGRRLAGAVRPADAAPSRCLSTGDAARDLAAARPTALRRDRPYQPRLFAARGGDDRARRCRGRRCSRVLGWRPHLAERRRPLSPDRAVPALRLRAVDAADVRALGTAALGRRVGRLARRDDPPPAVDRGLGLQA